MTSGDLEFVQLAISWVVSIAGSALVVTWDERRLSGFKRERPWPAASRNAAIYAFSPFCVYVHFLRTRRGARGSDIGLAWLAAILLADSGLQAAASAAIDWLGL